MRWGIFWIRWLKPTAIEKPKTIELPTEIEKPTVIELPTAIEKLTAIEVIYNNFLMGFKHFAFTASVISSALRD